LTASFAWFSWPQLAAANFVYDDVTERSGQFHDLRQPSLDGMDLEIDLRPAESSAMRPERTIVESIRAS
jgi:hypothetical protein